MGDGARIERCSVSPCEKLSSYTCPRCSRPYCSSACYKLHSDTCVEAFAMEASQMLRGVKTTDLQRRAFNGVLERMREMPEPSFVSDAAWEESDSDDDSLASGDDRTEPHEGAGDWLCRMENEQGADEVQSSAPAEPHVLEELLDTLDEPARQALFTVLNSAMENVYGRSALSPSLREKDSASVQRRETKVEKQQKSKKTGHSPKRRKRPQHVADTLEMLVEEMEMLDLSYEEILSRLPAELRDDFEKRLQKGGIDNMVSVWTPWWQAAKPLQEHEIEKVQTPAPLPPLPTAKQLIVPTNVPRQNASVCVRYSVADVLAAHAVSLRLCNGEWWGDNFAARTVWQMSGVLSEDARYQSLEEACRGIMRRIAVTENAGVGIQAIRDVADIMSGRSDWVARAMFECQCVLEAGMKVGVSDKTEIRKRVRKVGFFVSWAMCQESHVFEDLGRGLGAYADSESGLAEEMKVARRIAKTRCKAKIEVLE